MPKGQWSFLTTFRGAHSHHASLLATPLPDEQALASTMISVWTRAATAQLVASALGIPLPLKDVGVPACVMLKFCLKEALTIPTRLYEIKGRLYLKQVSPTRQVMSSRPHAGRSGRGGGGAW